MKYINYLFRFLVGALFIFSGFIKSNDTKGFAIKLHEYFEVFAKDAQADQDTFIINFKSVNQEGSYAVPLYEQETSKTYSIKTNTTGEVYEFLPDSIEDTDANWDKFGYDASEMAVNFLQATNSILRDSLYGIDSTSAGTIQVTATIAGKEVHNQEYSINLQNTEIIEAINVKPYLKKSGFIVGVFEKLSTFAVPMAMFLCLFEILLGIWLLLGIKSKWTVWLLLLMTLFFTFLTFYSAYYNKVTDCGCFGDAIKLTPWESFNKDIILSIMILFLFFTAKYIKPIFSSKFATTLTVVLMAFCTGYMFYSYLYLPVMDYLKYHEGSNIREKITYPDGALKQNVIERTMLYKDENGKEINIIYNSKNNSFTPPIPKGGTYIKEVGEKIIEAAYVLPIHDWGNMYNANGADISDSIMYSSGYTLLMPSVYVEEIHENVPEKITAIYNAWSKTGHQFYALTSSGPPEVQAYREKYKLPFQYGSADNKLLLSMIRSNPGLILIKDGVVLRRWCFRALPSPEKLVSLTK